MAIYLPIWAIILACIAVPLVSFFVGILYTSVFRKFTARLQGRTGPWFIVPKSLRPVVGTSRILQPFWDVVKLMYKQTIIPSTAARGVFISAPFLTFAFLVLGLWFLPVIGLSPFGPFEFSLIIFLYMLVAAPLSIVLSGATSSSPWGSIGSHREVTMSLAAEIPFIFGMFSAAMMTGLITPVFGLLPEIPGTLSFTDIILFQGQHFISFFGFNVPAVIILLNPFAAVAVMMGLIGKLNIKPMDVVDAEVEIISGAYTEYSGKLLGIYQITKIMMLFISITLFIDMFLGGAVIYTDYFGIPSFIWSAIVFGAESIIIILILSVAHIANARFRPGQAFYWYMKIPLVLGIIGLVWPYLIAGLAGLGINIGIVLV